MSSIPAESTIIYRFVCRFICVSLCQSIKITPTNMFPVSEGSDDIMVVCRSRKSSIDPRLSPAARRNDVSSITKKHWWIVLRFYTHIGSDSALTWLHFQGRHKLFFFHCLILISAHMSALHQIDGDIRIHSGHSFVRPSVHSFTTFSGLWALADDSLGRNGIQFGMLVCPADLHSADIDASGYCYHFILSSVRPTVRGLGFWYCGLNRLEEMVYILACWSILGPDSI